MLIFYDVDTQRDFMNKNGKLYIKGAESIKENLKILTRFALSKNIKILGSVDKHYGTQKYKYKEKELSRWGGPFPDHCMKGTLGQLKIKETLTNDIVFVKSEKIKENELKRKLLHKQIIFEKQTYDIFNKIGGNKNLLPALRFLGVKIAIVYGVATDYCVKAAAEGLLKRNIRVYLVKDAIKGTSPKNEKSVIKQLLKNGIKLITTKTITQKF